MSSSPFITKSLKDYIIKHEIEQQINQMLNKVLRTQPKDPYAELSTMMTSFSSMDVNIIDLKAYEIFNSEGTITITIEFLINYLAKKCQISTDISFLKSSDLQTNILFDEDPNRFTGKGM
jgi:hypothetical protein